MFNSISLLLSLCRLWQHRNWAKLDRYRSICHRMVRCQVHCRTVAFRMVVAVQITVFLSVSVVLALFVAWPSNWNRPWCREAKRSIRSTNAWKWPKLNCVHFRKLAANWSFALLSPTNLTSWPHPAKWTAPQPSVQLPRNRPRQTSLISSQLISKFQSLMWKQNRQNVPHPSK